MDEEGGAMPQLHLGQKRGAERPGTETERHEKQKDAFEPYPFGSCGSGSMDMDMDMDKDMVFLSEVASLADGLTGLHKIQGFTCRNVCTMTPCRRP
jgi:hypothetical protein